MYMMRLTGTRMNTSITAPTITGLPSGGILRLCRIHENKGRGLFPLSQFEELDLGDYLGSTYSKTLDKSLEKNPDKFIVYKPTTPHEFLNMTIRENTNPNS